MPEKMDVQIQENKFGLESMFTSHLDWNLEFVFWNLIKNIAARPEERILRSLRGGNTCA